MSEETGFRVFFLCGAIVDVTAPTVEAAKARAKATGAAVSARITKVKVRK